MPGVPAYSEIASELRDAIERGNYPEGSTLPKLTDIAEDRGIAKDTVRQAIRVLEQEGLVEVVRRRGTVVRRRPARHQITRSLQVYRDHRGYYFDTGAVTWAALRTPTVSWGRPPRDVADLLSVDTTDDVLIRERIMGDPETRQPMQLATSYLPADIARSTRLEQADTGPGGIYDRLEEMGHGPLRWSESVTARNPTAEETTALELPTGVPVLRIIRTATSSAGRVVEVNDTRMAAERFEIGYNIRRHPTARIDAATDDVENDEN